MKLLRYIQEQRLFSKHNIDASKPIKLGVTEVKREQEVVISLTTFPARIGSTYQTLCTLLHQDFLPDRVVLWLAREQFPDGNGIPEEIIELQKYGLEIRWYHDIRSYKKLIPSLHAFPNALIVTVDDDWFYPRNLIRTLVQEHNEHPLDVLCHEITHPLLDKENRLRSNKIIKDYAGTASYFHKVLSGSGMLVSRSMLDGEVLDETVFMKEAPTNDDIWFWAMAVKKGTKIRVPKQAVPLTWMTNVDAQTGSSLSEINTQENLYEKVTNRMLELYPEILENLLKEKREEMKNEQ